LQVLQFFGIVNAPAVEIGFRCFEFDAFGLGIQFGFAQGFFCLGASAVRGLNLFARRSQRGVIFQAVTDFAQAGLHLVEAGIGLLQTVKRQGVAHD